jgi:hypothetical protein
MTLDEVKQLNVKLQQQIQGKESVLMLFLHMKNTDTENPLQQTSLISDAFKFVN